MTSPILAHCSCERFFINLLKVFLSNLGGINPGRIVSTSMEDDHGPLWGRLQVCEVTLEVETILLGVVVSVLSHVLEASVFEDEAVVAPGGVTVVGHVQT